MRNAADTYATELLCLGHGYPLYTPQPDQFYDHVRVGDVGVIKGDIGKFRSVFNICAPADDPMNRSWGTPEGFQPLDDEQARVMRCRTLQPKTTKLRSGGVRVLDAIGNANAKVMRQGWPMEDSRGRESIHSHPV